ncbi:neurofilament medium polypeptide-like [Watersipora subatra]|uniref:neurofilament medium polypeptide-like n=1 Tax=Watersipora subatra TaxID=2589382 RepID=UPI00355C904B
MNGVFSRLKVEHKNKKGSSKEQVAEGTQREDTAKAVGSGSQTEEDEQEIAQFKVDMVEVSSEMGIEQESEEKNSKKQVAGGIQREDTQSVAESGRQTVANENETVHFNFDMNKVFSVTKIEQESDEGNSKEQVAGGIQRDNTKKLIGLVSQTEENKMETVCFNVNMNEAFSGIGLEQKNEVNNKEQIAKSTQREDTKNIVELLSQTESKNEIVHLNVDMIEVFSEIGIEHTNKEVNSKEQVAEGTQREDTKNVVVSRSQTEEHEDETVQLKVDTVEVFSEMGIEQESEEGNKIGGTKEEENNGKIKPNRQHENEKNGHDSEYAELHSDTHKQLEGKFREEAVMDGCDQTEDTRKEKGFFRLNKKNLKGKKRRNVGFELAKAWNRRREPTEERVRLDTERSPVRTRESD